ncbi:homoserine kinase [Gulosibacter sp. ACHW.36C]|jgi:homoserine kinase|uniref:Homoserine kinase n=1 Tax=Gulosibacter sediminis TaxID=1729695 RepID=A0ABY4MZN4_9MICO|nr:homoserine kinase [Gulosibacter sediminis]UQN15906.1 homoserine kinase [Gulosibacter sediminis]
MSRVTEGARAHVRVPATSANLGPGFDTLGLALAIYDELEVEALAPGRYEFELSGVGADAVPRDERHLVIRAMQHAFEKLGFEMPGIRLRAVNSIPHGRGLGSSGAAIVSGVLAAAGLISDQRTVTAEEMLWLATDLEGHPDNVAPCLFGGLTIAWMDANEHAHSKQLAVHRGVSVLVLVPDETMSTKVARSLQPEHVPHADAIFNLSRSALMVAAMIQSPELLFDATEDRLHQTYRAAAMPKTKALIDALREEGLAAVVSGAGPSVLVLCDDPGARLRAAEIAAARTDTSWRALMTAVDVQGATVDAAAGQAASAPLG